MQSAPRFLGLTPAAAAIAVITLATAFRFFYATWLPILPDEAYYYQWSRHLDLSYFSKGPAVAYTIATGTALFGGHNLGVRCFAVLLSAGTAWQIFLLARRLYDETVALLAVLIAGVVPLYAVGAVLMTIDPLSAFFWLWAANFFSAAVQGDRWRDWLLAGFAVGSGFLAKYINALELLAFLAFLLLVPARRGYLSRARFWAMLGVALFCTLPVWVWNARHGWSSVGQLKTRGHLGGPFTLSANDFLQFLLAQALVVSPLLFIALLVVAGGVVVRIFRRTAGEGEILLFLLFLSTFGFYAGLAWHMRGEPNWPAVSYLTLIILAAARVQRAPLHPFWSGFGIAAYVLGALLTVLLHQPEVLPLSARMDPLGRTVGWSEIAHHLDELRRSERADFIIADAYKEASVFSFHLPDQAFIYTLRHVPPANQYDFWPTYTVPPPGRCALWITGEPGPDTLRHQFATITPLERVIVFFRDRPFREYTVYRCENR